MTEDKKVPGTLPRITMFAEHLSADSGDPFPNTNVRAVSPDEANIVTSLLPNGQHAPVLDLDIPHTLVPSSTPGHSHLYLDVALPWQEYTTLLKALMVAGIIQEGFYLGALARGHSDARLPWVKKETSK